MCCFVSTFILIDYCLPTFTLPHVIVSVLYFGISAFYLEIPFKLCNFATVKTASREVAWGKLPYMYANK